MATVFMKWLERRPQDYDRGIRLLTLGRLPRLKNRLVEEFIRPGMCVLDIGCGTASLAVQMAQHGAQVTGIDRSPAMLGEAQKQVEKLGLQEQVSLQLLDASMLTEHFSGKQFDLIVATLVFSELPGEEQEFVLGSIQTLLAPQGKLVILDEVLPAKPAARLAFRLVRGPLTLLTWLLTRTTTAYLKNFELSLKQNSYLPQSLQADLGGSLVLFVAEPVASPEAARDLLPVIRRLHHQTNLRTLLLDAWELLFRIIPPYPHIQPGLYALGEPDEHSPVLVTGNFDLTIRRLVRALDGKLNAWILAADSAGINVWCAAGGGFLTAEKIIAALKSARLETVVHHHALILPQFSACGVDGWKIRQQTGWGVHWGPVRAEDIPAYLAAGRQKSDEMRLVRFPLKDRLEMVTVTLGFYGLLILLPVLIFWRAYFWPVVACLLGVSYFYALVLPYLPGRDGLQKSLPLTLIVLTGFALFALLGPAMPAASRFHWTIGLIGVSIFTACELQGMSPLMRGEQSNWSWEGLAAVVLGLAYWLGPLLLGWR